MKTKVSFSIEPELLVETECLRAQVDCSSNSEFFMKAVQFYIAYLHLKNNENFFGEVITSTLEGMLDSMQNRIGAMQFKQAVETGKLFRLLARHYNWSEEDMDEAHEESVEDAKSINGTIRYEGGCEF
ncbi:MAG: hypothetical protein BWY15_02159 [Firmicutes bacterium ADurb.Bin193]|nr:MAG: hypothetical protein BWY15_02159 [Firmicutes bacterium ADurb.Bin193]